MNRAVQRNGGGGAGAQENGAVGGTALVGGRGGRWEPPGLWVGPLEKSAAAGKMERGREEWGGGMKELA